MRRSPNKDEIHIRRAIRVWGDVGQPNRSCLMPMSHMTIEARASGIPQRLPANLLAVFDPIDLTTITPLLPS